MSKADLINRVATGAGVSRSQAEQVLDEFFNTVKSGTRSGDKVSWPGFGAFSSVARKARTGRNPQTGAPVKIPASTAIKFTAAAGLKDFMKGGGRAGGAKAAAKKTAAKKTAKKAAGAKKVARKR